MVFVWLLAVAPTALAAGKARGHAQKGTTPITPLVSPQALTPLPYVEPASSDQTSSDPLPASLPQPPQDASLAVNAPPGLAGFVLLGSGAGATLGLALLMAHHAGRPRKRTPPRKSFEAGRVSGRGTRVVSHAEAIETLRKHALGEVVSLRGAPGLVRVALKRRRGEACEHVAGYLTGLFEGAWAMDVALRHDECGGKERDAVCVYEFSRFVAPAAEASTQGSLTLPDRSPPTLSDSA
ncbi:MAG: hypothetical protein WDA16_12950 [Candidatus Thermoplasmatota archaeon]